MTSDGGQVKGAQDQEANLSEDFQLKQIERIVEAIALTLPNGGVSHGLNGTQSTSNLNANDVTSNTASQPQIGTSALGIGGGGHSGSGKLIFKYELVKELAADLGFDQKVFIKQLQSIFQFKL